MNTAAITKTVESARVNATNASNTAQWLRVQVQQLTTRVDQQNHRIAALEMQLQAVLQRVADLEDRLS